MYDMFTQWRASAPNLFNIYPSSSSMSLPQVLKMQFTRTLWITTIVTTNTHLDWPIAKLITFRSSETLDNRMHRKTTVFDT